MRPVRRTTADRMGAHRKLDRRGVYLCAGGLRKGASLITIRLEPGGNNHHNSGAFRTNFACAVLHNAVGLKHKVTVGAIPGPAGRKPV